MNQEYMAAAIEKLHLLVIIEICQLLDIKLLMLKIV